MSYFSQAATVTWQWICWCGVTLFLVSGFLLVSPVLAVWLALDFIPKRKPRPLKTSKPQTPKLPHLYRPRGSSDIFAEFSDGTVIQLEPMQAMLYAEACFRAVAGGYVHEMTRLRGDTEGAQPRL